MRRDDITPEHQHMNLSNDPDEARMLTEAAPEAAMQSRRQRLTGSATGVGSVGFDESGAFDVGAGPDPQDAPVVRKPRRS
ncbi:Tat pathway signal protein [Brevundimonas lenta]|uniref:Tat pathway signal protein n=1 Tax=Brevundimonas lenta TaxID=424796 RepID=A0A7W6NQP7_9CAUL|nr:Tat pathway signal protein [Brevundimonas lenta]MBB4083839.1 hypothetical protein [Brevundimonas lenta]